MHMAGVEEEEKNDLVAMPAKLQELLEGLQGNALSELPDLSSEEYGDYFTSPWRGTADGDGRHWRVRKRVLAAIGQCRSLGGHLTIFWEWEVGIRREDEFVVLLGALASTPFLEGLGLDGCTGFERLAGCKALGQLIASSRSLRRLEAQMINLGAAGLGALVEGFFNKDSALEYLDLGGNRVGDEEGAQHLARMLANAPRLNTLDLRGIGMNEAGAQRIAKALPLCATLRVLALDDLDPDRHYAGSRESSLGPVSTVLKLAFTRVVAHAPISGVITLRVEITNTGEPGLADALAGMFRTNDCVQELRINHFAIKCGLDALRHNSTLSKLELFDGRYGGSDVHIDECMSEFWLSFVACKSLRILTLSWICWPSFMKALLQSLEKNTSLQELNILDCRRLDDELFRELMQSLQGNTILQKIDIRGTNWDDEGKGAIINATLARNVTHRAYWPLLLEGQEAVKPRVGRLFLCGAPYAGKTTLRTTMVGACSLQPHKSTAAASPNQEGTLTRTEGIEIEVLRNDHEMEVTIWDLAGQAQYRALQDYLFPSFNQPCVFVFTFKPFDTHKPGEPLLSIERLLAKFTSGFKFWLRFIHSNSRNVGSCLPRVFVVVTHKDQMEDLQAELLVDLLEPVVTQSAKDFEEVLRITTTPLFFMDARSKRRVQPLLDCLFQSFRQLFALPLFWVPEVCNRFSAVLTRWVSQNPAHPLVTKERFKTLSEEDDEQRLEAILAYLHNAGRVLWFQHADAVVVNPHWISHSFLGRLIQRLTGPSSLGTSSSHGFVAERFVYATLARILKDTQVDGIGVEYLVSLMKSLNLCYEDHANPRPGFFVPFTLDDGEGKALQGKRQLDWKGGAGDYSYVGRRLQCRDERKTFLGPGCFPRFQVKLRQILFDGLYGMQSHQYSIARNLIKFNYDGMDVFLESSGDIGEETGDIGDRVDILVRSLKSSDETIEFLQQNIVAELRAFCASPEGSPGVELVEGIIRTECVEKLTLCIYRHNQSVLTQHLMKCFLDHHKRHPGQASSAPVSNSSRYRWCWPEMPEAGLSLVYEEARDLLSSDEVQSALKESRPRLSLDATSGPSGGTSQPQVPPVMKSGKEPSYANERAKAGLESRRCSRRFKSLVCAGRMTSPSLSLCCLPILLECVCCEVDFPDQ